MTTKVTSKQIKDILKTELGINPKSLKVSVNIDRIWVTAKDLTINLRAVEKTLKPFEDIQRCPITGRILSGWNFYTFCQYE